MTYQTDPLATATLINPFVLELRQDIAEQMHSQRPGYISNAAVLTNAIADITFDLTVQGASYIEVLVIDPYWQLLRPNKTGHALLDVDENGLLLPVELNFPKGSQNYYFLVAANPTSDMTGGNIKLTFEDSTVYKLRNLDQHDGPSKSNVNETRLEFILRLLKTARITARRHFSADTARFESSPPSFTPQEVIDWDKRWTALQAQRQKQAAQVQSGVKAVDSAINGVAAGIGHAIGNLLAPPPPGPTGTISRNQWWAGHAPGAENSGSADYIPNAGYIPGL